MTGRRLSPDEAALWQRVMATVRPIAKPPQQSAPAPDEVPPARMHRPSSKTAAPIRVARPPVAAAAGRQSDNTLDASWDKALARGAVGPDRTIDLHGHSLDGAYHLLDDALDAAIRRHDRVILLVTGKPPRPESERPHARGAIRAAVADWLAGSRHARSIAAVRGAHPRHGGAGALYIVLRRQRISAKS